MFSLPHQTIYAVDSLQMLGRFAGVLAGTLRPGDVVALDGPLGAGKTTLIRELASALGVRETIASPSFVLMHEYRSGPFPVLHADLYRLGEEKAASLAEELFAVIDEGRSLALVEWACYGMFLAPVVTFSVDIAFPPTFPADTPDTEARLLTVASHRPLPDLITGAPA